MFDICLSLLLLMTVYPLALVRSIVAKAGPSQRVESLLKIPLVFSGRYSFVGRPFRDRNGTRNEQNRDWKENDRDAYLGPRGLTGLVQINYRDDMTKEEVERYQLYYAKNQSLFLDIEILLKSLLVGK
jgi:lipopolysaccharide/colanic/teichoic acid biosynthesis glycosyltransferase